MDNTQLKVVMIKNHESKAKLAEAIGLTYATLCRKLKGQIEWKLIDVERIAKHYSLTNDEIISIFFEREVA